MLVYFSQNFFEIRVVLFSLEFESARNSVVIVDLYIITKLCLYHTLVAGQGQLWPAIKRGACVHVNTVFAHIGEEGERETTLFRDLWGSPDLSSLTSSTAQFP